MYAHSASPSTGTNSHRNKMSKNWSTGMDPMRSACITVQKLKPIRNYILPPPCYILNRMNNMQFKVLQRIGVQSRTEFRLPFQKKKKN